MKGLAYCAEHRHDVPGFGKLEDRFESVEDYAGWMKFDKRDAVKVTKVSVAVLGGAVLLGPMALVAAPAIGGSLGVLTGLSGAAATSHGLALLGGGALAAGGFGMAGGVAVVTAAGTALGGALGASVTTAYVSSDESFRIEKLRDGCGPAVLLASGFLTEKDDGWGPWRTMTDRRFPASPVYRVHWGAKELRSLGILVANGGGGGVALKLLIDLAKGAKKGPVPKFGPLGAALAAHQLATNPWTVAKRRAEMTGAVLADVIARIEEQKFVLMGHSLGARVILTAAQALGTVSGTPRIEDMHLLGAAVTAKCDLRALDAAVAGHVWNYWSSNDMVLRRIYRVAEAGHTAAGAVGFHSTFPKIMDRNVSQRVHGHSDYFHKVTLQ